MIPASFLFLALLAGQAPPPVNSEYVAPRVRGLDVHAVHLITDGRARSRTVRSLLDRLQRGYLTVLVRTTGRLSHFGELRFLGTGGRYRYAEISIRVPSFEHDPVTWLAHELQHAVEILEAPHIVDQATLKAHAMSTPGMVCRLDGSIESEAAQRVWAQVNAELMQEPPPPER